MIIAYGPLSLELVFLVEQKTSKKSASINQIRCVSGNGVIIPHGHFMGKMRIDKPPALCRGMVPKDGPKDGGWLEIGIEIQHVTRTCS